MRELGAGRGGDDVAVDARLAPPVLQYDPADAPVSDEQVGPAAQDEHGELVLARHLYRIEEIFFGRDAKKEISGPTDPQGGVWREGLAAGAKRRHRHTGARSRSSSRSRIPAGRMSPAPSTSTRSPGRAWSARTRAAASGSAT